MIISIQKLDYIYGGTGKTLSHRRETFLILFDEMGTF